MRYSEGYNTPLLQGGAGELPAADGEPPGEREPQPGVHRQPQRPQQQHLLQGHPEIPSVRQDHLRQVIIKYLSI